MNGRGIYKWPDGRIYEGDYVDDKKEGQGILISASGKKYDGAWKSGK